MIERATTSIFFGFSLPYCIGDKLLLGSNFNKASHVYGSGAAVKLCCMPGARKLIIAQMARAQSPHNVYTSMAATRSNRLRSREYTLVLLAGLFVLACFFYSRDESGLRAIPTQALPNAPFKLPPSIDPSVESPASPAAIKVDGNDLNAAFTPGQTGSSSSTSSSDGNTDYAAAAAAAGSIPARPGTSLTTETSLTPESPRAVIIESETIPNLIPIMLHFTSVLGPSWGMILFTLQDRWIEPLSPAFQRHLASGRIEVRFLPKDNEPLTSSQAVSRFLTSPWLWEQVSRATRILLFQTDSVICSKSQVAVDEYLQYDFVGAPIDPKYGKGYNGGLSIRNPRLFLQIAREVDFGTSGQGFEDQFFYLELQKRGAEMPPEEVAKTFAVETVYYETPLGYHQPQRWQADKMKDIEDWCPEVKMLIGRRAG